ncbi:MAG: hypothetical protein NZ898_08135, partial [Myxococcota bacterium]|nr:hypothetical protein [Myxococcota bacterium]
MRADPPRAAHHRPLGLVATLLALQPAAAAEAQLDEDENGPAPARAAPAATQAGEAIASVHVVAVAADPALSVAAARAQSAIRAALRATRGVSWQTADLRLRGGESDALDRLEQARVRIEEGRQAYLDLDLERA